MSMLRKQQLQAAFAFTFYLLVAVYCENWL